MMQKPLKIRPPCHILADNFITGPSFQNLNVAFLTKWPQMLKVYRHLKTALWWQNWNLQCHRMSDFLYFQFQLCHQRAVFKCQYTFNIYGHLVIKAMFNFLKDGPVIKLSAKMWQGVWFSVIFASLLSSIVKLTRQYLYSEKTAYLTENQSATVRLGLPIFYMNVLFYVS